jgi:hypothetical protein
MRSYTCRTCKEHFWQLLQREIPLELEADTTLHNTSFARQAKRHLVAKCPILMLSRGSGAPRHSRTKIAAASDRR